MAVRKRTWTTESGERREAWVLDYYDQHGARQRETYDRRKDAEARAATVAVNIHRGIHSAISSSITVAEAAEQWITTVALERREQTTLRQYRQHINHIVPRIGHERLATLTTPRINAFRDELLKELSRPLARKLLVSLKSILSDAQKRGTVAQNVALPVKISVNKRDERRKLQIGIDIPTPAEIKDILAAATGRKRAIIITATFTGLRASELRGLRWIDVDLKRGELHVRQRVDRYNHFDAPKKRSWNAHHSARPDGGE